jgi:HD superfamily phosphohydrolase
MCRFETPAQNILLACCIDDNLAEAGAPSGTWDVWMAETDKIIRGPIHGFVKLNSWEQDIVDHWVFQRLRRVRQLALTEMVYPAACHNRFEHSLGVMHVATLMFDQLRPLLESPDVTEPKFSKDELDRARVVVRLAALTHDVGHCPFSHAGEDVMPHKTTGGKRYKHEDYSLGLIRHQLAEVIDGHRLNHLAVTAEEICDSCRRTIRIFPLKSCFGGHSYPVRWTQTALTTCFETRTTPVSRTGATI